MDPCASKQGQGQSTLFQTWGYHDVDKNGPADSLQHQNAKAKTSNNHRPRTMSGMKPLIASNRKQGKQDLSNKDYTYKSSAGGTTQSNCLVNFDGEDVATTDCFGDDDDLVLLDAAESLETATYLEPNSNRPITPEKLQGFDESCGNNYIYPTNYPVREYQFNIIKNALIRNTLVVLPTGLGKTFIAAVVMYNYYRWYPQGKVIFMAPTKPLVAQQIQACYNIMGIPQTDTAEMTGTLAPNKRKLLWQEKRVFFLTPQVLQNDLGRGALSAKEIVCLVFDEAHKALGNHAYCQVTKDVYGETNQFRILALSATPGGDMKAVQQVVINLLIAHVELRSEDSPDIKPYTFGRNVQEIVIPLSDEQKRTKSAFVSVLDCVIRRLCAQGALWQKDPQKISKFLLLKSREQFRARGAMDRTKSGAVEGDFALAISLYHAYELLHQHGLLSFYNFLKGICEGNKSTARARYELMKSPVFMDMMQELQERIEPSDDMNTSLNASIFGTVSPKRRLLKTIPKPNAAFSSHPKLDKLRDVVLEHFRKFQLQIPHNVSSQTPTNTRIMIFSQYRDSVQEITAVLSKHQPLVKVMSFVGQAAVGKNKKGLSQKEQLEVMHRFRTGGYNTLVSTSVGEEGLDIGEVDLIICFDASNSPIRLVQRMGRTGRKRTGKIVILITEGKEEQVYKKSQSSKRSIHKTLMNASRSLDLYNENPRMIPRQFNPYCHKMQITVGKYVTTSRGKKRKSSDERQKITKFASPLGDKKRKDLRRSKDCCFLDPEEQMYWETNFELATHEKTEKLRNLSLTDWSEWQCVPQTVKYASHSTRTYNFCEIMEFIDMNRTEEAGELYDREMRNYLDMDDVYGEEDSCNAKVGKGQRSKSKGKSRSKVTIDDTGEHNTKQDTKKQSGKDIKEAPKGKTWRQEYLKRVSEENFDEEGSDFEVDAPPKNINIKSGTKLYDEENETNCHGENVQIENETEGLRNHETDFEIKKSRKDSSSALNSKTKTLLKGGDELITEKRKSKEQHPDGINPPAGLGNNVNATDVEDLEDFPASQTWSSFLPLSTPENHKSHVLRKNSSLSKTRRSLIGSPVPSPPKFSDLSALSFGEFDIDSTKLNQNDLSIVEEGNEENTDDDGDSNSPSFTRLKDKEQNIICGPASDQLSTKHDTGRIRFDSTDNFAKKDDKCDNNLNKPNVESTSVCSENIKKAELHSAPNARLNTEYTDINEFPPVNNDENKGRIHIGKVNNLKSLTLTKSINRLKCFSFEGTRKDRQKQETSSSATGKPAACANQNTNFTGLRAEKRGFQTTSIVSHQIKSDVSKQTVSEGKDSKGRNDYIDVHVNDAEDFGIDLQMAESIMDVDFPDCPSPSVVLQPEVVEAETLFDDNDKGVTNCSERTAKQNTPRTAVNSSKTVNTETAILTPIPRLRTPLLSSRFSHDEMLSSVEQTAVYGKNNVKPDCETSLPKQECDSPDSPVQRKRKRITIAKPIKTANETPSPVVDINSPKNQNPAHENNLQCPQNDSPDSPIHRKKKRITMAKPLSVDNEATTPAANSARYQKPTCTVTPIVRRDVPKDVDTDVDTDEHDESDEEQTLFRKPSRKAMKRRMILSQSFQSPTAKADASDDDDFDTDYKKNLGKHDGNTRSKSTLKRPTMQEHQKKRIKSNFIEEEAEMSGEDHSDDEDDEENEVGADGYMVDSFIDNATQYSQETPQTVTEGKRKEKVDMQAVYKQSLMSPYGNALNFRTPLLRAGGTRFKMVEREQWKWNKSDTVQESDSEAEEVMGLVESDQEHDVGSDDEDNEANEIAETNKSISPPVTQFTQKYPKLRERLKSKGNITQLKRIIESDDEDFEEVSSKLDKQQLTALQRQENDGASADRSARPSKLSLNASRKNRSKQAEEELLSELSECVTSHADCVEESPVLQRRTNSKRKAVRANRMIGSDDETVDVKQSDAFSASLSASKVRDQESLENKPADATGPSSVVSKTDSKRYWPVRERLDTNEITTGLGLDGKRDKCMVTPRKASLKVSRQVCKQKVDAPSRDKMISQTALNTDKKTQKPSFEVQPKLEMGSKEAKPKLSVTIRPEDKHCNKNAAENKGNTPLNACEEFIPNFDLGLSFLDDEFEDIGDLLQGYKGSKLSVSREKSESKTVDSAEIVTSQV